jgi:hypothetical protein
MTRSVTASTAASRLVFHRHIHRLYRRGEPTAICEAALAIIAQREALDRVLVKSVAERFIHALRMQAKRRKIRIAVRSLLWCSFDSSTDLRKFTAQAGPEIAQRHN